MTWLRWALVAAILGALTLIASSRHRCTSGPGAPCTGSGIIPQRIILLATIVAVVALLGKHVWERRRGERS